MANAHVNPISSATSEKIKTAVDRMVDYYRNGTSPNESLAKVATEFDLQPNHLRLVGRGFNSGQTLTELRTGSSLAEKTAGNRELADIESVINAVYTQKSANNNPSPYDISAVYLLDPRGRIGKAAETVTQEKQAHIQATESNEPEKPPVWARPDLYSPTEKMAAIVELRRYIQDLDRQVSLADNAAKQATAALRAEMGGLLHTPEKLAQLRSDAGRFHGREGVTEFNSTLETFRGRNAIDRLRKEAEAMHTGPRTIPSVEDHPVLLKLAASCCAKKKCKKTREDQTRGRMLVAKLAQMIRGQFEVPYEITDTCESKEKRAADYLRKYAFNVSAMMGGLIGGRAKLQPGVDPASSGFREMELQVEDPEHDKRLKEIRLRASLQTLMDYDPIVSGYDPDEVLAAFNELSQSAPSSVDNPVFLQSNLRRLLQGNMDPHESQQIQSAEQNIRKNLTPLSAQV